MKIQSDNFPHKMLSFATLKTGEMFTFVSSDNLTQDPIYMKTNDGGRVCMRSGEFYTVGDINTIVVLLEGTLTVRFVREDTGAL